MMDLVSHGHGPNALQAASLEPRGYGENYSVRFSPDEEAGIFTRLRRQKLLFSTVFVGVLAAVAAAYLIIPPVYKAEALVTIGASDQVVATQQTPEAQQLTVGDAADLESQSVVLSSPMLMRELLAEPPVQSALLTECEISTPPAWKVSLRASFNLKPTLPCQQQLLDTTAMVESLRTRVAVGVSGRSRIITLTFSSPSPSVAQTIASAIVQTYLETRTQEKLQPRAEAISWLQEETRRVSDRLKQTETQIQSYLHANGVVKGQLAPIASEQLTSLAQQIAVAEAERATAAGKMQQALASGGANTGVLENRTVNDEKQQLAAINSQVAQLSTRYGSAYPPLADLLNQRRAIERAIAQDTSTVARSAMADYQAANSRVIALQRQVDELKQEVRGNDDASTQVAALTRNLATDRELYLDLTKSLNQLETNRRLVSPNAHLVSLAEVPQFVSFPKASSFGLTGLILAIGLASIAALVRDRADGTVRTVTGLQSATDVQVLARIPHVPGIGRGSSRLSKRIQNPSAFQEAIRALYAECLLVSHRPGELDKRRRSIMVTSSNRGEGKTFTTLALAHFAAAAGRRVLVVECDLRQPSVARSLSLPTQWGVSEILEGQISPDEAVASSKAPGLDVILAGKAAMCSAELLGAPRMAQLLAWATARYDLVLIDTPPSRVLPDARILAPSVDGVLYCVQWGQSQTNSVVQGIREIQAAGGQLYGLVLDGVLPTRYRLYDKFHSEAGSYLVVQ